MKYQYICLLLAPLFTAKAATYCNPMDIDYQYAEIPDKRKFFKEPNLLARGSADPVLINHQVDGKHQGYYLFSTTARGYWHSTDLANWQHIIPTNKWPVSYFESKKSGEDYKDMIAPAAYSLNNKLYLLASNRDIKTSVYVSDNPSSGKFEIAYDDLGFPNVGDGNLWDPGLYHENDQWYIFWGSSNVFPLFGTKLKKQKDNSLKLDRWLKSIINLYPEQHGWERFGHDHTSKTHPYIEGSELTKNNGKYYLQYSAPGTSENVYADGVYVADAPLGPYSYAKHNPMSYKPGGFVHGMGHGNTFQDAYGNYWHTGTSWVGVNWVFERRISMIPAGFDKDGNMYSSSRFADFPHHSPSKKWQNSDELFTGWMLLSYKKPSWSTSHLSPQYSSDKVTDE
ncbi:MAG: family 43 glycosylhydrolase, partial [Colwellia sp.]|nr:family 43 glycosylhydrolase [Colwellia sp.]